MLKLTDKLGLLVAQGNQPPSGGCVLKQDGSLKQVVFDGQPPSGGCVLKLQEIGG